MEDKRKEAKKRYLNKDKDSPYARTHGYRRWTVQDDELILQNVEGVTDLHLALLLGRSIQAIQCRRSRLLRKGAKENVSVFEEKKGKREV